MWKWKIPEYINRNKYVSSSRNINLLNWLMWEIAKLNIAFVYYTFVHWICYAFFGPLRSLLCFNNVVHFSFLHFTLLEMNWFYMFLLFSMNSSWLKGKKVMKVNVWSYLIVLIIWLLYLFSGGFTSRAPALLVVGSRLLVSKPRI